MLKINLVGVVILLFILLNLFPMTEGYETRASNTIYVDDECDGDYTSIKEALNNSNPGDTIEVYSGIYYEHRIRIETEDITIKGISHELGVGNDIGKPFIDGEGFDYVIEIRNSNNVTIKGFCIENGGKYCISNLVILNKADNCIITNNEISRTGLYCIFCRESNNVKILNNNISNSSMSSGICFYKGKNNTLANNIIYMMEQNGIRLWNSNHNSIENNSITECKYDAISVQGSNNIIKHNKIDNNTNGVSINGNFNLVEQNNFINNNINAQLNLDLFVLPFYNTWINNYWNKTRLLPYPIRGTVLLLIPWLQFDLLPAKESFDLLIPDVK